MKKRIIKYALMGMLFLLSVMVIQEVKAEKYTGQAIWPSEHISGIFIKKVKPDGYTKYQQARFIRRSEDNKFVYCLQPFVDIDNNLPYYDVIRSDYASVLNMSEDTWTRINLIAYYGYAYTDTENGYDHSAHKWYAVSQVMIWRLTNSESDIYFTDTLNGSRINSYDDEIAEINALVDSHFTRPNFNSNDLVVPLGQSVTLTDENGVLKYFKVASTENVNATISGNNLTLTSTGIGNAKVNFVKNATSYEVPPIVYYSNHSQNVFRVGHFDPLPANFSLKVVGGRVGITKVDNETGTAQGDATLSGAKYGVYNTSNELLFELTTNDSAYAISGYLPSLGEFYVKEITPSKGYTLDVNRYSFIVDENNLLASINVYEKVINRDFEITKVYASNETLIMTPEIGVKFEVYNGSNKLVGTYITDNNGKINYTLPYGSYTLKQITSTSGYEKIDDYVFEVKETGNEISKVFSNAEITARLKVIKVDDNNEVIAKSGIKFKIKDTKTNNYICQKVSYPTVQNICIYETDNNGVIMTPYPLNTGTYQLEEQDQVIDGYTWNQTPLIFTIDENSNLLSDNNFNAILEVKFINKKVKGKIEINKVGEDLILKNEMLRLRTAVANPSTKYFYLEMPLMNVKYGLYDENDNLLETLVTDKNGYAELENLKLGKYKLKELESSNNNLLDTKVYEFELKYKDQYTPIIIKTFDFENHLAKGTLEFTKTDISTSKGIKDTVIEIYTENDVLIYSGETNEEGKIIIEDLFVGKFYIIEKEASTGYVLTDEKVSFEIKEDGQTVKASMTNEKIKGRLEFTKTDISTSEPLPNTKIEIYNDKDELVFEKATNENGQIIIENIEYGKYYIIEKEAPVGYILNDEKMYFEIKENGEVVKSEMTNTKIKGTLKFIKLDSFDNKVIPNTKVEIYNDKNELLYTQLTNEDGQIIIENLEYGKYYIKEIKSADGYQLSSEIINFEITENEKIIEVIMTNNLIVEVPNTETKESLIVPITSITLMILGLGVVIYANKKKRK